jgi:hypothetical protein
MDKGKAAARTSDDSLQGVNPCSHPMTFISRTGAVWGVLGGYTSLRISLRRAVVISSAHSGTQSRCVLLDIVAVAGLARCSSCAPAAACFQPLLNAAAPTLCDPHTGACHHNPLLLPILLSACAGRCCLEQHGRSDAPDPPERPHAPGSEVDQGCAAVH